MPKHGNNFPLRPMTKVQLRLAEALRLAGFTIKRDPEMGNEYLVYGFGQAALAKKLDSCMKTLLNKVSWAGDRDGIIALEDIYTRYENGEFL